MHAQEILKSCGRLDKSTDRFAIAFLSQFSGVSRSFGFDSDPMKLGVRKGSVEFPDRLSKLAKLTGRGIRQCVLQIENDWDLCRIP